MPHAEQLLDELRLLEQFLGVAAVHDATLVEHHMDVVTGLAQRIAVMHHGALLACDTPDAVMRNETVQAAYLGEEL